MSDLGKDWLIRRFFRVRAATDSPIDEAFLARLETISRSEVAGVLRRIEALSGHDVVLVLRACWVADRTLPRPAIRDSETPPVRAADSLVFDFGVNSGMPRARGTGTVRGSPVAEVYLLGEARVADRLFELLTHPRAGVRQGASDLCSALTDERHLAKFAPFLESEFPEAREAALRVIAEVGDETWMPHLVAALQHANSGVRRSAVTALVRLHPKEAAGLLTEAAEKGAAEVQLAALEALGALGENKAIPVLLRFLTHKSVFPRVGAARGLVKLAQLAPDCAFEPVLLALQQRLRIARRLQVHAAAEVEMAVNEFTRNLTVGLSVPVRPQLATDLTVSEIRELGCALRVVANAAGVDPATMTPVIALPIPAKSKVEETDSLPIADFAPKGADP